MFAALIEEKTMRSIFTMAMAGLMLVGLPAAVSAAEPETAAIPFRAPRDADIFKEPNAAQILLGKRLLSDTKHLLPENVGDGLNCTSCHLGEGKVPLASPYVGVSTNFPAYAARAGKEIDLAQRINGCFLRSENGKAVPPDSPEMKAMLAYFQWLSAGMGPKTRVEGRGAGKVDTSLVPDPVKGKAIYETRCASCHGDNGEGVKDVRGEFIFPPLWGDESFNIGAGMARTYTAAAFVKNNMPVAWGTNAPLGQGGALTDQEAVDVAEYFTHQPRPDFPAKVKDWPNGGKPKDARY
jgi:thiosulfate dehydrogenase